MWKVGVGQNLSVSKYWITIWTKGEAQLITAAPRIDCFCGSVARGYPPPNRKYYGSAYRWLCKGCLRRKKVTHSVSDCWLCGDNGEYLNQLANLGSALLWGGLLESMFWIKEAARRGSCRKESWVRIREAECKMCKCACAYVPTYVLMQASMWLCTHVHFHIPLKS